eukprot:TRINITY_DN1260_c0_g1_i1.p1 TRINITY_DN1260_c0_g1~~TRINITY_DN1260_c0_g1_i1.p1  ORF type:complete len:101 (-),score=16.84 TRINITY_DN1260_c0_g1_i1:24-326(-)
MTKGLYQILKRAYFVRKSFKNPSEPLPPQKKGVVIKEFFSRPRKPNSAQRRTVTLLCGTKKINAYVPGEGTKVPLNSKVLIHHKRCIDVPGLHWSVILKK